jgi:hypothetical protein
MLWFLLGPGPSMSRDLAERVRGNRVCAVCNAYELAPWADVLVANDIRWWQKHPKAYEFAGRKFSANQINGVEKAKPNTFGSLSNSGVLGLDVVRNLGATKVVMLGFDMHGTHFFGPYRNGCSNTSDKRRQVHKQQFAQWGKRNPGVEVLNATEGTHLKCFPIVRLDEVLHP